MPSSKRRGWRLAVWICSWFIPSPDHHAFIPGPVGFLTADPAAAWGVSCGDSPRLPSRPSGESNSFASDQIVFQEADQAWAYFRVPGEMVRRDLNFELILLTAHPPGSGLRQEIGDDLGDVLILLSGDDLRDVLERLRRCEKDRDQPRDERVLRRDRQRLLGGRLSRQRGRERPRYHARTAKAVVDQGHFVFA